MFIDLKSRYEKGWATKDQLQRFVALGKLTQEEYGLIVGVEETLEDEQETEIEE